MIGHAGGARLAGDEVVITQRGSWNELDYPAMVRLQKLLLGRADAAISNSAGGAEMLAWLGLDPGQITVITNGIPPSGSRSASTRRDPLRSSAGPAATWSPGSGVRATRRRRARRTSDPASPRSSNCAQPARQPLALIGATADELEARGFALPSGRGLRLAGHPRPADRRRRRSSSPRARGQLERDRRGADARPAGRDHRLRRSRRRGPARRRPRLRGRRPGRARREPRGDARATALAGERARCRGTEYSVARMVESTLASTGPSR